MKKLKVLDLFSGIGGFSLGLERTGGFETVAFCEIDEAARKVLKKHWPDTIKFSDVTSLNYGEGVLSEEEKFITEDVHVICGGFPCQDISVAGKGEGLDGKRSGLWKEYARLIKEIRPRYAIIENVANLRSKGLTAVMQDLWEIGYDCEWHIISACSIGAVHRRERIWIIAYPNSSELWQQSGRRSRTSREEASQSGSNGQDESTSNTDHLRLWKPFTSEEAKQEWRSEATTRFSYLREQVLQTEPSICGGNDGFPRGLDKPRKERIKQLGNAVVPQIPELIGNAILEYEGMK